MRVGTNLIDLKSLELVCQILRLHVELVLKLVKDSFSIVLTFLSLYLFINILIFESNFDHFGICQTLDTLDSI